MDALNIVVKDLATKWSLCPLLCELKADIARSQSAQSIVTPSLTISVTMKSSSSSSSAWPEIVQNKTERPGKHAHMSVFAHVVVLVLISSNLAFNWNLKCQCMHTKRLANSSRCARVGLLCCVAYESKNNIIFAEMATTTTTVVVVATKPRGEIACVFG